MMYCLYPGDLSWAFPMPPNPALYTQLLRGHVIAPRFHFIPLNAPGIFGYSACWHGGLVSLFAHTSLADMPDYDRPHDTWFFLPVNAPRERIASIWRRESDTPNNGSVAIQTSSGRLMVWGPYPQDGDQGSPIDSGTLSDHSGRWELIHLAGRRPSRIHYEDSDFIHALAFEGPMPSSAGRRLVIPPRNVPMHPDLLPDPFFYNEAPLRGVGTVIPCKVGKAYTGMVLLYRGGRKGSVGSVRLDRLRRPIQLNNRSDIWFGTSYESGMYPYISAIAAREPRSRSPRMRVNGTARLGWRWSRSQSQITFKNRKNSELCPLLDSGKCATYPSTSATPHSSEFPLTDCYSDKPIAPEHLKLLAMTMYTSETPGESSKDGAGREDTDNKSQRSSRLEGHDEEGHDGERNKGNGVDTSCADAMTESEIDRRVSIRVHAVLMARYSTRSRTSTAPGNVMRPTGNYMWTARERMRQEDEERERQLERERGREREREMALAANANRSGAGNDSRPGEGSGTRRTRDEDSDAEDQRLMREALESHGNRDFYDQIYRVRLPSAESPNGSARDDPAIGAGNDEEDEIDDSPTTTMRVSREGAFERRRWRGPRV
ncbi:hypothetical protein B0I35DRAFT_97295 [Stachybotrys elegans]|uniref:Uncharacterized protein n=1 Tax=Stachybotrys elegans TaxID=80388 RepID=A0A8K0SHP6_9HYPO|nr:hypothetical protein B0I35DRAFT_97295 [Stachybotrys elegans]